MTSPGASYKTSASRIRNMMSSPGASALGDSALSRIELDVDQSVGRWAHPVHEEAALTSRTTLASSASHRRDAAPPERSPAGFGAWDEERRELLLKLAAAETSREGEISHLRVRVGQLTNRVAELDASLSTVHRALEEEAATAIGLQRHVDAWRSKYSLARWRERFAQRRLHATRQANAVLIAAVEEAVSTLPTAAGGSSAPLMRKALEELAWCEKQWAEQRLEHLKRSSLAFRGLAQQQQASASITNSVPSTPHSPERTAGPSPQEDVSHSILASTLSSAKVLLERADGIAAAKFQVLLQSFQSYARCDKVHQLLEAALKRAQLATPPSTTPLSPRTSRRSPDSADAQLSEAPSSKPWPMEEDDVSTSKHVLLRSMRYDVLRDTVHSIVTVVILPPALQILEDAVQHHPILSRLMEGLDELLMQHPLSTQVERCLQTCFSKHLRLQGAVEAAGRTLVGGRRLPEGANVATAVLVVEEPPTVGRSRAHHHMPAFDSATTRQLLHGAASLQVDERRPPTPVQARRALRWDLVHSILNDDVGDRRAVGGASTPRISDILRRDDRDDRVSSSARVAEAVDSSIGRLEHARRSVRQSHRSSAL